MHPILSIFLTLVSIFMMCATFGVAAWVGEKTKPMSLWFDVVLLFGVVLWLGAWALSIPIWWGQAHEVFGV